MISRFIFAIAALGIGLTPAMAQDAVKARKDLMSANGKQFYGVLGRMQRGQEPYDQAKVDAAFAALAEDAGKVNAVFATKAMPEKRSDYDASPKIWENKTDFDAKAAAFTKAVADNRAAAKNVDTLKAVYQSISSACNACHESYRVKN
jgi:cytochrome c556